MAETDVGAAPKRNLVQRVAELLSERANARLVYGEPVERGEVTVIPVARVRYGFGGGGGHKAGADAASRGDGEGGGGGLIATPAGFVVLRDGDATYRTIRDPTRMIGLVLAMTAGALLVVRAIARVHR